MTDNQWASNGPDDSTASSSVPAFLEVEPGRFESIEKCTPAQIRAVGDSKLLEARALMDEARRLYEIAERGGLD